MNVERCSGCRNDFYNGNNEYGVKQCWFLETAKLIKRKEVHINQVPPWNQKAKLLPSCYHKPQHVYVDKNSTC